jgi:hypothetical protein
LVPSSFSHHYEPPPHFGVVPRSPSHSMVSSPCSSSNFSIKSDYLLHSKVKKGSNDGLVGGLTMDWCSGGHIGRKSLNYLVQIHVLKDIRSGKRSTIVWSLKVGKAQARVAKWLCYPLMHVGLGEPLKLFPLKVLFRLVIHILLWFKRWCVVRKKWLSIFTLGWNIGHFAHKIQWVYLEDYSRNGAHISWL